MMFVHYPKLHFFFEFLEHCDAILECFFNKKMSTVRLVMYLKWGYCVYRFQFNKWIEALNTILSHSSFDKFLMIFQNCFKLSSISITYSRPKPKLPNFWKTRFITIYLSQTTRTGGSYITSYYHMHNQQKYHDIPTKTISQENYVIFRRWFSTMS